MSRFGDLYQDESIRKEKSTPLSNAKSYWSSKFGSQHPDAQIALAPHTVRLMECCSIAVNRYCVVIGTARDDVPKSSRAHQILDLQNHSSYDQTIQYIRDFLSTLDLRKIYTFRIEEAIGPHGKISISTMLIALWKFIALFQPELDNEEKFREIFTRFIETKKLKITRSEIQAIINGSERNVYFNVAWESIHDRRRDGNESELLSENVAHFFNEFDLIYVRSSLSESDPSTDKFFKSSFIAMIKEAFTDSIYDEEDNMDIEYELNPNFEFNTVTSVLSTYSKSRIQRENFPGSSYEKTYQGILENLSNKYVEDKWIKGGVVTNEGIILCANKSQQVMNKPEFLIHLTETFLDAGRTPNYINLEKLRPGFGARHFLPNDLQNELSAEESKINIIPSSKLDDPGLFASSSSASTCQDQHFVLDNSDIVETDDDCAEIF